MIDTSEHAYDSCSDEDRCNALYCARCTKLELDDLAALKEQNALLTVQVQTVSKALERGLMCAEVLLTKQRVGDGQFLKQAQADVDLIKSALTAHPQQVKSEDARDALITIARGDARSVATADQCSHGKYGYEDCELCICDFAEAAISAQEKTK